MGINYEIKEIQVIRVNGVEFNNEEDAKLFDGYVTNNVGKSYYILYSNKKNGKYNEISFYSTKGKGLESGLQYEVGKKYGSPLKLDGDVLEQAYELVNIGITTEEELSKFLTKPTSYIDKNKVSRTSIVKKGVEEYNIRGKEELNGEKLYEKLLDGVNTNTHKEDLIKAVTREIDSTKISEDEYYEKLIGIIDGGKLFKEDTFTNKEEEQQVVKENTEPKEERNIEGWYNGDYGYSEAKKEEERSRWESEVEDEDKPVTPSRRLKIHNKGEEHGDKKSVIKGLMTYFDLDTKK